MKYFPLILGAVLMAAPIATNAQWQYAGAIDFTKVVSPAPDKLIAIGDRGSIFSSSDYGQSWTQALVPTYAKLNAAAFLTPKSGIVVGDRGTVLSTKDGGKTWTLLSEDTTDDYTDIAWPSYDSVVISARSGKLTVSDHNFVLRLPILRQNASLNAVRILVDGTGLAVSDSGVILLRRPGTKDWKGVSSPIRQNLVSISAEPTRKNWFIGADSGYILISTDKGQSWANTSYDRQDVTPVTSITYLDDTTVFAIGQFYPLLSKDGGFTWMFQNFYEIKKGLGGSFQDVQTFAQDTIIVGSFGGIFRKQGPAWTMQHVYSNGFSASLSISAIAEKIYVTAGSKIYRSDDRGVSFYPYQTLLSPPIFYSNFQTPLAGTIGGTDGDIRTTDGGESWTREGRTRDSRALQDGQVIGNFEVLTADSTLYITRDGGVIWLNYKVPGANYINAVDFKSDLEGYVTDRYWNNETHEPNGNLYYTSDGAETWSRIDFPKSPAFSDLYHISSTHSFLLTTQGYYESTDAGANWKYVFLDSSGDFRSFAFNRDSTIVIVGHSTKIYVSRDLGVTWSGENYAPDYALIARPNFNKVVFQDDSVALVIGDQRMVRRRFSRKPPAAVNTGRSGNEYLYLTLSPVPAGSRINVMVYGLYSVRDRAATLKIYDVLGREVMDATELLRNASDGRSASLELMVSAFPNGVYQMVLVGGGGGFARSFTITR